MVNIAKYPENKPVKLLEQTNSHANIIIFVSQFNQILLYYENSNILVDMPELGIKRQEFFLYAVILRLSSYGGYRTELSCCRKEAFELAAKGKSEGTTKPFREPVVRLRKDKNEKR